MLRKITKSPYLNLSSGLILLMAAGYETWESFEEMSVGTHHGVLIYSMIHMLKAIPEIMHGLKETEEAEKEFKIKHEKPLYVTTRRP